jgi:hypothetical protein
LIDNLQVGIQWNTEVISTKKLISQIFCSAVPISYNEVDQFHLEEFAKLILEAAYEATFLTAILNKSNVVYLTLLGGGAFGNEQEWIFEAIAKNIIKYKNCYLDIRFINRSSIPNSNVEKLKSLI